MKQNTFSIFDSNSFEGKHPPLSKFKSNVPTQIKDKSPLTIGINKSDVSSLLKHPRGLGKKLIHEVRQSDDLSLKTSLHQITNDAPMITGESPVKFGIYNNSTMT